LDTGGVRAAITMLLDSNGHIATISAPDRPRQEGKHFVERPWHGRFADYRQHQGRSLPFAAEVGWRLDGQDFTAWQGRILDWSVI
jgi:hypothetical protein